MSRQNQLENVYSKIEAYFDSLTEKSFPDRTLRSILNKEKHSLGIPDNKFPSQIIAFLSKKGVMHEIRFTHKEKPEKLVYYWKDQEEYTVVSGLKKGGYFTHYSAMFLHQLTLQVPKVYYLNYEHAKDYSTTEKIQPLTQQDLDDAFNRPQRKAKNTYSSEGIEVTILNGKKFNRTGVIHRNENQSHYAYTDLERTLIDIAVRPVYAGGVFEVLEAYNRAKDIADPEKIASYLNIMNFTYPYEKAIGFYLERAGYAEESLKLFEPKDELKFYLTYDIRNRAFSDRWQIYHPKGI